MREGNLSLFYNERNKVHLFVAVVRSGTQVIATKAHITETHEKNKLGLFNKMVTSDELN